MQQQTYLKGCLSAIVLQLLQENKRMYGYEITQKVKEQTNGELVINEGALYPALHKLEAEGLLTVTIEQVGNRPRKYYALTEKGEAETTNRLEELTDFVKHMQLLLNPKLSLGWWIPNL